MSDPFESAEFSIRRANKHSLEFARLAQDFVESDSHEVFTEFNADTGLNEVKVKFLKPIPEDLRGVASDAIKNIRDALDQAMSAATLVVSGKRTNRAHFPFGESADDLENSLSRKKAGQCKGIPEALYPILREIRPYPHEGDQFRLKLLQKVSGPHKHSVALSLAPSQSSFAQALTLTAADGEQFQVNFPIWKGGKGDAVIATFPGSMADFKMSHPFHIEFDHAELAGTPAGFAIDRWGMRTDQIIQGLKKFARQIAEGG